MNKSQFSKNLNRRVRIRPIARDLTSIRMKKALPYMDIEFPDDIWMIQKIEDEKAEFHNLRTMQVATISYDQIIEYMHDPQTTRRKNDGFEYGFVRLKVQIFIHGLDITSEPVSALTIQKLEEELLSSLSK